MDFFSVSLFLSIFVSVRYSTSYQNKAICRRILSYMPSSEGIFYWINDIRRGIIVLAWQYSGQKLFFSGRKKNYSESISK